ncbi:hypothetical protein ABPG74_013494 [Tetrahymena malaccensis]
MKKSTIQIAKIIVLLALFCFFNVQAVQNPSQKLSKLSGSVKALAIIINDAFNSRIKLGNLAILQQLKKQLVEIRQESESSQDAGVNIINMNKDTLIQGQMIVKKDSKIDKITAKDNILISENLYSKTTESTHIKTEDLYINSIHSLNSEDSIIISGKIVTKKLTAGDKANIAALKVNGQTQWQLIEHEDFESHNSNQSGQWSLLQQNSCQNLIQNKFNGGYCKVSSQQITKVFKDLPEHTQIKLSGTLHAFDNWEGEKLYVQVNGKQIWSKSIDNSRGVSVCGNDQFDQINIKFEKILLSSDNEIEVTFGSELKKDSCDASYAIDDIILSVR